MQALHARKSPASLPSQPMSTSKPGYAMAHTRIHWRVPTIQQQQQQQQQTINNKRQTTNNNNAKDEDALLDAVNDGPVSIAIEVRKNETTQPHDITKIKTEPTTKIPKNIATTTRNMPLSNAHNTPHASPRLTRAASSSTPGVCSTGRAETNSTTVCCW